MSKSQVILIIAGVLSVIFLFSLPKIIVKNQEQLSENTTDNQMEKNSNQTVHTTATDQNDLLKIEQLRKQYLNFSDKEKKLIFADSLAGYFRKVHLYDSVITYRNDILRLEENAQNLIKAGDAYTEAYSFDPDHHSDYQQKARELFQAALAKEPENNEVKSRIAMTYIGGNEPMKGVQILLEIVRNDPKNETALYNLGVLAVQSGQYDKAVNRFNDLIKVNANHGPAHFYLGLSYAQLGQKDKAKEYYRKAKKLDNDPGFQATVDSYLKELK